MTKLITTIENHTFAVEVERGNGGRGEWQVRVNGELLTVRLPDAAASFNEIEWLVVDGRPYEIVADPDLRWLKAYRGIHRVEIKDQADGGTRPRSGDGRIKAPIPGLINRVMVSQGEIVEAGQPLLVLEAMKMENEIRAGRDGVVSALHVTPGQSVTRNELLAEIS
ncbi:MAG: biotin/lipoyl-binding protein [Anaerolineae bacterium]|nr:biotin/lipoyl-binding protein [Anaerolineae bacterium]